MFKNSFENNKNIVIKIYDYRINFDTKILSIHRFKEKRMFLSCIFENKILSILRKVYDENKH